jgi:hypothetical protein
VVSHALRRLDRATTAARKAVNLAEVADDQWQLVKQVIGIGRGWQAADRAGLHPRPSGQELPANLTP